MHKNRYNYRYSDKNRYLCIMKEELPYEECNSCTILDDCKHVEVSSDMLGTPLPPDNCPRPIDILRETFKKHKLNKKKP